jgi:nitrogenase subunit NifH
VSPSAPSFASLASSLPRGEALATVLEQMSSQGSEEDSPRDAVFLAALAAILGRAAGGSGGGAGGAGGAPFPPAAAVSAAAASLRDLLARSARHINGVSCFLHQA